MPEIRVPTMVLAAGDDPWIPVEHYRAFEWSSNPWLLPVIPPTGGHVGFHGDMSGQAWSDLALEKFLKQDRYDRGVSLDPSAFRPRFPWWGGDLQTLANRLRPARGVGLHASERLSFTLPDGDTLLALWTVRQVLGEAARLLFSFMV